MGTLSSVRVLDRSHNGIGDVAEPAAIGRQHQIDHQRDELPQQGHAVLDLLTVDLAAVGGPAMDELVAEDVQPVDHDARHGHGFAGHYRRGGGALGGLELLLPTAAAVVVPKRAPEGIEQIGVVDQGPDAAREVLEQQGMQALVGIEQKDPLEEAP